MAAIFFKTRYFPNVDGTESTTAITNANTTFLHTYLGDDSTGDGTREKPYRSAAKALLKGLTYILFRGVVNEAMYSNTAYLIGDDINQVLITNNYAVGIFMWRLTVDQPCFNQQGHLNNIISRGDSTRGFGGYVGGMGSYSIIIGYFSVYGGGTVGSALAKITATKHLDIGSLLSVGYGNKWRISNSLFNGLNFSAATIGQLDVLGVTFKASSIFKYGGVNIVVPAFGNDSLQNITLLKNAYIAAGAASSGLELLFYKDTFGNQTCRIINETLSGGNAVNVFNGYSAKLTGALSAAITAGSAKTSITLTVADSSLWPTSGDLFLPTSADYISNGITMPTGSIEVFTYSSITINSSTSITLNGSSYTFKVAHLINSMCTKYGNILDITLNPDPTNEAIYCSSLGDFVGGLRPAVNGIITSGANIVNVNDDGTDTSTPGTLMTVDSAGNLIFNTSSQTWNRLRDANTIYIPVGSNFKGMSAMSQDGSPFGNYLGKKQNLIDTNIVNPGDALVVGQMYKIFNDTANDVTKSIVYNGVNYRPEYTFICVTGVTTFSLLNAGSGTYCKKVLADVLESIEILPYDDANTPSAFPKFSAPLMGECKLLYYTSAGATRYGKTAGNPVLFGDLSVNDKVISPLVYGNMTPKIITGKNKQH